MIETKTIRLLEDVLNYLQQLEVEYRCREDAGYERLKATRKEFERFMEKMKLILIPKP